LPSGLQIFGIAILIGQYGPFASLPTRADVDRTGVQKMVYGKPSFSEIMRWRNRELARGFSARVIEAIRETYPGVLGEQGEIPLEAETVQ
jgi:hypothetical protein